MIIIPAIDLWKGNVVRFMRGSPDFSKVYSANPIEIARKWAKEGARLLHLVDLSAALSEGDNVEIIREILKEVNIDVEIGGGIRDLRRAEELIQMGAKRLIIGTKGLDERFLEDLMLSLGRDRVAVSADVIDAFVAVEGWQRKTELRGLDFIKYLQDKGVKWVIYTDISRDGTLQGVNLEAIKKLAIFEKINPALCSKERSFTRGGINLIVSGGVSCLEDIKNIKKEAPFVWGIIAGKALYEERVNLPQAIFLLD
ncbi:MAG: 1-(5-phosphoribosyl)-5-((5-phosphoribosylamino)methylideneamino)imidazole-4-carboxamide isomerase [Candidatus Omnitrophica bacterium]|nr:1-(5-phosphoribosyl)-5-((5-phosphoribosylamino)methylideneamino)imidazole-4-carboxamide isomerase [Candidatus Omnitrophota bacterium]MBU2436346.1 1-(5-phosphoribosyl)-5-((5-phosphoribosylamino)methylideneamino)imidazole-4-carboxamide isomerase [Candidatus Omnitrophota bacterium]